MSARRRASRSKGQACLEHGLGAVAAGEGFEGRSGKGVGRMNVERIKPLHERAGERRQLADAYLSTRKEILVVTLNTVIWLFSTLA